MTNDEYLLFLEEEEEEEELESPEEDNDDDEDLGDVEDDDLKAELAEKLGLDPEENSEVLDKVFEREKANRTRLSKAIKQKRTWREKAQQTPPAKKPENNPGKGKSQNNQSLSREEFDQMFEERMENERLRDLNLPNEEIEQEVKDLAKLKGISVREAVKKPYIQSLIGEVEKEERINNATPKRGKNGKVIVTAETKLDPKDFDLSTKEGQEAWAEAKKRKRQAMSQQ